MIERLEAHRRIAAPAARIFAELTDPAGHVRLDGTGMLLGSPRAEPVTAVGDRFLMHMDRDPLGDLPMGRYDVTVVIEKLDPGRVIEWSIDGTVQPPIGHVYGYLLEPVDDGATEVTSYYDWSGISAERRGWRIFPVIPESALGASLERLELLVAAPRG